jgi:hypothetical protein
MPEYSSIFNIHSAEEFQKIALDFFDFQSENCTIYREFIQSLGKSKPTKLDEIPFLPIDFFKTHNVTCYPSIEPEKTFLSSGTTQGFRSKHPIHDLKLYETSFLKTYEQFIGQSKDQIILALLPNYVEQGSSSLVYMVDRLIEESENELSGFLLNNLNEVEKRYKQALISGKKVIIFGVSYALLDLAEQHIDLSNATIIETGGMKGRRKEMTKTELHTALKNGLNVPVIHSEYGMTELLSQAYSDQNELFTPPNWMKISCRDVNDPFHLVAEGKTGGINVIDLANINSCCFIATQDLGQIHGNQFKVMGRFDQSDIRGCNLLIE